MSPLSGRVISDADAQRKHWTATFARRPDFLGSGVSEVGRAALTRFAAGGVADLLELGPGQGRDTIAFAAAGLSVTALDFAPTGLEAIATTAAEAGLGGAIRTVLGDVRDPLPFDDAMFDASYAHMLFCMALTSQETIGLASEVHRIVRPGGLLVYSVRTVEDAHYRAGTAHGDDRWEMGGFVVHFFDRALIDQLAAGWDILEVADFEEGPLPRRLAAVTMRRQ
jgi:SAM-dependent methyltransferase